MISTQAIAGAWALAAHWVERLRRRELWWFTIAAEVVMVVQIVLGVWLVAGEDVEAPRMHMLYGFSCLFGFAIVYSYALQMRDRIYLLYGAGGLFLMGLGLRALQLS